MLLGVGPNILIIDLFVIVIDLFVRPCRCVIYLWGMGTIKILVTEERHGLSMIWYATDLFRPVESTQIHDKKKWFKKKSTLPPVVAVAINISYGIVICEESTFIKKETKLSSLNVELSSPTGREISY